MKLLASAAGEWGPDGCSANPSMEEEFGEVVGQSDRQREGDAAHFVFSQAFREGIPAVGSMDPKGSVITDEMIECAQDIIRDIVDTQKAQSPIAELYVEYSFNPVVNIDPENVGRADAVLIDFDKFKVFIWEYKYGHRFVDEYRNWQIINAAIGVMENLGLHPHSWPQWQFVGTVAQPRNYHPNGSLREWNFTGNELLNFAASLKTSAEQAQSANPTMTTGTHCRDCAGQYSCTAALQVGFNGIDLSMERTPARMSPEALGLLLVKARDAEKRLKGLAEGLEEQALSQVRSGVDVPHWKAEYSQGKEKWNLPPEQVVLLGENLGVDLRKPQQTLTPHQARKAGLDETMVKSFADRPRGAMTLIRFSPADAVRRFQ